MNCRISREFLSGGKEKFWEGHHESAGASLHRTGSKGGPSAITGPTRKRTSWEGWQAAISGTVNCDPERAPADHIFRPPDSKRTPPLSFSPRLQPVIKLNLPDGEPFQRFALRVRISTDTKTVKTVGIQLKPTC